MLDFIYVCSTWSAFKYLQLDNIFFAIFLIVPCDNFNNVIMIFVYLLVLTLIDFTSYAVPICPPIELLINLQWYTVVVVVVCFA